MRKSIYLLGMAVAALSSCSQSDVVEMPDSAAIKFNSFVNNNTRAVTEEAKGTLSGMFYVFGKYGDNTSNFNETAFDNEPNNTVATWVASKNYRFGAYKNGTGKIANAEFTPAETNSVLKFPDYVPNDANDLIAAFGTAQTGETVTDQAAVALNFKHLLSQVKLTFTTKAAKAYNLTIKNVKITNAISKSTCTYTDGTPTIVWETVTGVEKSGYTYEDFNENGKTINSETSASQAKLVIPQAGTNSLTVTFTATVSGNGATGTQNFTANLTYNPAESGGKGDTNTWTPGYRYNYTAEIDVKDVAEGGENMKEITFTPSVEDWADADNSDLQESEVPQP